VRDFVEFGLVLLDQEMLMRQHLLGIVEAGYDSEFEGLSIRLMPAKPSLRLLNGGAYVDNFTIQLALVDHVLTLAHGNLTTNMPRRMRIVVPSGKSRKKTKP
jgi:hypothetical protein